MIFSLWQQYSYCLYHFDNWELFQSEITIELHSFCSFQWLLIKEWEYRMSTEWECCFGRRHVVSILNIFCGLAKALRQIWLISEFVSKVSNTLPTSTSAYNWVHEWGTFREKKGVQSTKIFIHFLNALNWEKTYPMLVARKETNHTTFFEVETVPVV